MANRLYNKQVTPKGYQKGGKVKKDYKLGTKFQGDYKGKSVPGKVKEFFKTGVKQTIGTAKKIGEKLRVKEDPMRDRKKQPLRTKSGGKKTNPFDPNKDPKKRLGRKMGGSLKPVNPQTQKGLSKLPTEVRNKMGYMKKGGKVHGK
jgi:hypothetical protein